MITSHRQAGWQRFGKFDIGHGETSVGKGHGVDEIPTALRTAYNELQLALGNALYLAFNTARLLGKERGGKEREKDCEEGFIHEWMIF